MLRVCVWGGGGGGGGGGISCSAVLGHMHGSVSGVIQGIHNVAEQQVLVRIPQIPALLLTTSYTILYQCTRHCTSVMPHGMMSNQQSDMDVPFCQEYAPLGKCYDGRINLPDFVYGSCHGIGALRTGKNDHMDLTMSTTQHWCRQTQ